MILGKLPDRNQQEFFCTRLADLINTKHGLAFWADKIEWKYSENEFKPYYSDKGASSRSQPDDGWLFVAQAFVQS